jgi:hypothetical protein
MNAGVICDLSYKRSISMSNYYHAVGNIFDSVKLINSCSDLDNIDLVFVGNDHFEPHKQIWLNDNFITECNNRNIKFCVYTAENILSPVYPHNIQIQRSLERFNNLYQRVIDPDDAIALNKKIARCMCSRYYKDAIAVPAVKLDKCVFIGGMYDRRRALIDELRQIISIDVVDRHIESWEEYMSIMSNYRFVLSPHSFNANSFHLKFYEALMVDSIPIHQVFDNTLEYYPTEAKYDDALYFKTGSEVPELIANCKLERSYNKPWLEDELVDFFAENGIFTK